MPSWRDQILKEFVPNLSKLTLVADPDALLTEERLAVALRQRGFELIEFTDPVEFRYVYESGYRSVWDRGEQTDLVVILRAADDNLESLPFDLLQAGRTLAFDLGSIFPQLSYPVIETLDRGLLDALFAAQQQGPSDRLGDNATRDFILRHVFGVAAELVTTDADLLRALLRLHYSNLSSSASPRLPSALAERLIAVFKAQARFSDWPLEHLLPDAEAFFAFMQERWPVFVAGLAQGDEVAEPRLVPVASQGGFQYPGPDHLPFDHHDIRVYIDNLFLEGRLTPILTNNIELPSDSWVRSGLVRAAVDDEAIRMARLFDRVAQECPPADARHSDWISFALLWAELSAKVHASTQTEPRRQWQTIATTINSRFVDWLADHYASLINLPPTEPAMLHQMPRRLAREMEQAPQTPGGQRVALIVVDGLALDQWVGLRPLLHQQIPALVMRESATFAWIPTLTSVSRQAIFAGKPPRAFPDSIHSTHREEKLWTQFWESQGLSRLDLAFQRGLGDGDARSVLGDLIHPRKTRAVGLVVDKVDKIMHGMQLGAAGMHQQIQQWCQTGFLAGLIDQLLDWGFAVWLTADHGNLECQGQGRPNEGVVAETRGERVRVYPSPVLRSPVTQAYSFAREWPPIGLPEHYYPLLAGDRHAFVTQGETIVGHGGAAIEEVIVPLIRFERRMAG
ncbi:BREX-3 system phosphatase PglZ [Thiorhodovibrio frisius]|uniref:PglZ domain-containing protein n=1 Tax=Thiorhodovibrio frisius TaxID=631362 RepID=H8YWI6_9GAMM|nr:BREX-3 system phosphatase PglZ [Thiorhodovibrio frisius]EIC22812.1 PglZ domain-containing protein [Thiorhodovibrio frisius]WPL22931.1 PglZ domain protein [Thiorhodovibrio frisius]